MTEDQGEADSKKLDPAQIKQMIEDKISEVKAMAKETEDKYFYTIEKLRNDLTESLDQSTKYMKIVKQ